MVIYCTQHINNANTIRTDDKMRFGIAALQSALKEQGLFASCDRLELFLPDTTDSCIAVSVSGEGQTGSGSSLSSEGFEITRNGEAILIRGADGTGAMYGMLDAAETIKYYGVDAVCGKVENPFMKMRGVKFNLPYQPFATGDAFSQNEETCMDVKFWKKFIDFLALNRYNCLSLWSENPFDMMFRIPRYPEATSYSDAQIAEFKAVYQFIFGYAKKLGIQTYLITWNIRITPDIARGLGLPAEIGGSSYSRRFMQIRQHQEAVKDYFKEAIKTLIMTFPDLTGLGTSNSEEMVGTPDEREDWVVGTYLEAIRELNMYIPFIHRTNMSNGTIAKQKFMDEYKSDDKYISWKYSNAHMYSHHQPQFEELWHPWEDIDMKDVKVLYTVRNDDFHNLRGGDPEFISKYVKGMGKPYIHGFYWGADGYVWAKEFQHVPHKHVEWDYSFEKHWMQFETLGRLGYNPDMDEDIWVMKNRERYGRAAGEPVYRALQAGTRFLCAVNRLFWINYDYQWHPETLLSTKGFKTILDFMDGTSMPGVGTTGIREHVENRIAGKETPGESPEDIIGIIEAAIHEMDEQTAAISTAIPDREMIGELQCTVLDIRAWRALAHYYLCKFKAAQSLVLYELTGTPSHKGHAVSQLRAAVESWKKLSAIGSSHYLSYTMARVNMVFGWGYYLDEVEKDVLIAENMIR